MVHKAELLKGIWESDVIDRGFLPDPEQTHWR